MCHCAPVLSIHIQLRKHVGSGSAFVQDVHRGCALPENDSGCAPTACLSAESSDIYSRSTPPSNFEIGSSNKTELYRIAAGRKHNRYGGGCRFGSERTLRAGPSDHVHFALNKISDECGQTVVLALRPAVFDRHIVPLNVAGFTEPFDEGG